VNENMRRNGVLDFGIKMGIKIQRVIGGFSKQIVCEWFWEKLIWAIKEDFDVTNKQILVV